MTLKFLIESGQKYEDFLLVNYKPIEELQIILREIVHVPTGVHIMHLENDDPENLFCLSFQTLPKSSNGAAHILEHTVLCGSRKYPVKDPFFAMSRRSLNTFMNALTGSDFTCYPAASQVEKDFYNLLEVYLDAVFHPLLKELSFLQEGHRVEFTTPNDPSTHLEFKGIVFNEMKGSLSSAENRIWYAMMKLLVPDLPYAFNSGGDPKEIPNLTYAELIEFHETYYHPSRCLFFFYGNFPLKKHLDYIAEHALKGVVKIPPQEAIGHQAYFEKPIFETISYPTTEEKDLEDKCIFALGFLTIYLLNQKELLILTLLDSILMDTDASPFKRALLETKLCIQVDSFIDAEMTQIPFVFMFRGCHIENGEKIKEALFSNLKKIAEEGIPYHLVEASLHQLEFAKTEIGGNHSPFGLVLFMRSALTQQHGCSPEDSLTLHALFEQILEETKDPHFFTPFIEKYFLKNTHFVSLTCTPDPHLSKNENADEIATLEKLKNSLNEKQIAKILDQTKELAAYQQHIEDQKLECLPKVTLQDVPAEARQYPLTRIPRGTIEIYHHEVFTNHILYADLIFDLPTLKEEELFDLQLFTLLWPELGAGSRSYDQNLEFIHAHTGGFATLASLYVQAKSPEEFKPSLQLHGKALSRKADKLFTLLHEMATAPRFNEKKRISELIKKLGNSLQTRMTKNAMRYASQLSLSGYSIPNHINEIWHGLHFYNKVQNLVKNLNKELPSLLDRFQKLKEKVLLAGTPHLVLSCDEKQLTKLDKKDFFGLPALQTKPTELWEGKYHLNKISHSAYSIPSPVAFTAQSFKTVQTEHRDAPALQVATLLLDHKVLHHRIREQGGAYGAGAHYTSLWGNFYFYSYRDPHIARTLRTFRDSVLEIGDGNFDARDLEEAKLGIIQSLDTPTAPGNRAMLAYSWQREGRTHQMRQNFRDHLLALSGKDVQNALNNHILPQVDSGVVVTFASKELLDKELPLIEDKKLKILN